MSTDDLNEEVVHGLVAILTSVVHNSVALRQILLSSNFGSSDK